MNRTNVQQRHNIINYNIKILKFKNKFVSLLKTAVFHKSQ